MSVRKNQNKGLEKIETLFNTNPVVTSKDIDNFIFGLLTLDANWNLEVKKVELIMYERCFGRTPVLEYEEKFNILAGCITELRQSALPGVVPEHMYKCVEESNREEYSAEMEEIAIKCKQYIRWLYRYLLPKPANEKTPESVEMLKARWTVVKMMQVLLEEKDIPTFKDDRFSITAKDIVSIQELRLSLATNRLFESRTRFSNVAFTSIGIPTQIHTNFRELKSKFYNSRIKYYLKTIKERNLLKMEDGTLVLPLPGDKLAGENEVCGDYPFVMYLQYILGRSQKFSEPYEYDFSKLDNFALETMNLKECLEKKIEVNNPDCSEIAVVIDRLLSDEERSKNVLSKAKLFWKNNVSSFEKFLERGIKLFGSDSRETDNELLEEYSRISKLEGFEEWNEVMSVVMVKYILNTGFVANFSVYPYKKLGLSVIDVENREEGSKQFEAEGSVVEWSMSNGDESRIVNSIEHFKENYDVLKFNRRSLCKDESKVTMEEYQFIQTSWDTMDLIKHVVGVDMPSFVSALMADRVMSTILARNFRLTACYLNLLVPGEEDWKKETVGGVNFVAVMSSLFKMVSRYIDIFQEDIFDADESGKLIAFERNKGDGTKCAAIAHLFIYCFKMLNANSFLSYCSILGTFLRDGEESVDNVCNPYGREAKIRAAENGTLRCTEFYFTLFTLTYCIEKIRGWKDKRLEVYVPSLESLRSKVEETYFGIDSLFDELSNGLSLEKEIIEYVQYVADPNSELGKEYNGYLLSMESFYNRLVENRDLFNSNVAQYNAAVDKALENKAKEAVTEEPQELAKTEEVEAQKETEETNPKPQLVENKSYILEEEDMNKIEQLLQNLKEGVNLNGSEEKEGEIQNKTTEENNMKTENKGTKLIAKGNVKGSKTEQKTIEDVELLNIEKDYEGFVNMFIEKTTAELDESNGERDPEEVEHDVFCNEILMRRALDIVRNKENFITKKEKPKIEEKIKAVSSLETPELRFFDIALYYAYQAGCEVPEEIEDGEIPRHCTPTYGVYTLLNSEEKALRKIGAYFFFHNLDGARFAKRIEEEELDKCVVDEVEKLKNEQKEVEEEIKKTAKDHQKKLKGLFDAKVTQLAKKNESETKKEEKKAESESSSSNTSNTSSETKTNSTSSSDDSWGDFWKYTGYVVGGIAVATGGYFLYKWLTKKEEEPENNKKEETRQWGGDEVILETGNFYDTFSTGVSGHLGEMITKSITGNVSTSVSKSFENKIANRVSDSLVDSIFKLK